MSKQRLNRDVSDQFKQTRGVYKYTGKVIKGWSTVWFGPDGIHVCLVSTTRKKLSAAALKISGCEFDASRFQRVFIAGQKHLKPAK